MWRRVTEKVATAPTSMLRLNLRPGRRRGATGGGLPPVRMRRYSQRISLSISGHHTAISKSATIWHSCMLAWQVFDLIHYTNLISRKYRWRGDNSVMYMFHRMSHRINRLKHRSLLENHEENLLQRTKLKQLIQKTQVSVLCFYICLLSKKPDDWIFKNSSICLIFF